jgi:RHS repeat-associated protein
LAVVEWIADVNGFWDVAANWRDSEGVQRVPAAGDDVIIDQAGADVTVTYRTGTLSINTLSSTDALAITGGTLGIESNSQINTLQISNSGTLSGAGVVTVTGALNWTGGTMAGTGATVVTAGAALNMAGGTKSLNRALENAGTAVWTNGTINLSAALRNLAGGMFDVQGNLFVQTQPGAPSLANLGTFRKTSGTGSLTIQVPFDTSGLLEVQAGNLILNGDGTMSGPVALADETILDLRSDFTILAGAGFSGDGLLRIGSGAAAIATVQGAATVNHLNLSSSGTIAGPAPLTVTGSFELNNGTIAAGATVNVAAGATLNIAALGGDLDGTLNNAGSATMVGSLNLGGTFNNLAGASFHAAGNAAGDVHIHPRPGSPVFNNFGTFHKSVDNATTQIRIPFHNSGTVEVQLGNLRFEGGGTSSGPLEIGAAAILDISQEDFALLAGTSFTGPGLARFGSVGSATITVQAPVSAYRVLLTTSGTLAGPETLTVTGSFQMNRATIAAGATVNIAAGAVMDITASENELDGTLNNSGTAYANGTLEIGGTFNNLAGATYDVQAGAVHIVPRAGTPVFHNAGRLVRSGGTGQMNLSVPLAHSGILELQTGTLLLDGGGTIAGPVDLSEGTTLFVREDYLAGGLAEIRGKGLTRLNTGVFTVDADMTVPRLLLDGSASIAGSGTLTVTESMDWQGQTAMNGAGATAIEPGAALTISGVSTTKQLTRKLENRGAATWTGGTLNVAGTLHNLPGATLDLQGNVLMGVLPGTPAIVNDGRILKSGGTGTATIRPALDNHGSVEVHSGTLRFEGLVANFDSATDSLTAGSWMMNNAELSLATISQLSLLAADVVVDGPGAFFRTAGPNALGTLQQIAASGSLTLQNGPDLTIAASLNNAGRLTLGAGSSLAVSNYTQTAEGSLTIGIGGRPASGEFGRLVASNQVTLDGELAIELAGGYGPVAGDSHEVLAFAARSGQFAETTVPLLGQQPAFEVITGASSILVNSLVNSTDLRVLPQNITFPDDGLISYTVDNLTGVPAEGQWVDSLYLSADDKLDAQDRLIGRVTHNGPLGGLASYSETVPAAIAGKQGFYRVIVVADSRGLVPDSDRANNKAASSGAMFVDVPALPLGQTVTTTILKDEDLYFRLDAPLGEDVLLRGDFSVPYHAELFARYGQLPTRSQYDVARNNALSVVGERQIVLTGGSQPWYILLHGREGARSDVTLDLTAEVFDFGLLSATPDGGASAGAVTTTLAGFGFTPATTARLVAGDGGERAATRVLFLNSTTLLATFDLTALSPDTYELRIDQAGQTASLPFVVFEGEPGQLEAQIESTRRIRPRSPGNVTVTYRNTGSTDVPLPMLLVQTNSPEVGDPTSLLGPADVNDSETKTSLKYEANPLAVRPPGTIVADHGETHRTLLGSSSHAGGVIPPGGTAKVDLRFHSASDGLSSPPPLSFTLATPADPDAPIDWLAVKDEARPQTVAPDAWDAIFANFVSLVGPTIGDFHNALAAAAAYLSQIGPAPSEVDPLIGFLFQQADNAIPAMTLSAATDAAAPSVGLPLALARVYQQPISSRYELGIFGRGWTHNYDVTLLDSEETVLGPGGDQEPKQRIIVEPGRVRYFERVEEERSNVLGNKERDVYWRGLFGDTGIVRGRVLTEADGARYTFDLEGLLSSIQHPSENEVTLGYKGGRLVTIIHSTGDIFTLVYNAQGRVQTLTDQAGRTTSYTYDASGEHLLEVTGPFGTIEYAYVTGQGLSREHALEKVIERNGFESRFHYDDAGRLVRVEQSGTKGVFLSYEQGAVTFTDGEIAGATVLFNAFGQPGQIIDRFGEVTYLDYDATGYLRSQRLPENVTTEYTFEDGFLTEVTDPLGSELEQQFGPSKVQTTVINNFPLVERGPNRLLQFDDALNRRTEFEYDLQGNLLGLIYPDGMKEQFTRDDQGNVASYTNRRGQVLRFTYNDRGEVTRRDHEDGTFAEFTYDGRGNLLSATDLGGTTAFTYDLADRLKSVTYPGGRSLAYTYDSLGRLTRLEDQDGRATNYTFDFASRLKSLTDAGGNLIVEYFYDTLSRLMRENHGNGTFTTYEYDDDGQLLHLVHHAPDESVSSRFDYVYDALGRRTSMATLDGAWTYEYDALGQMTRAVFASTNPAVPDQDLQYDYDAAGNRIRAVENGQNEAHTTNIRNQYTAVGTAAYSYDADGNLVARSDGGQTESYTYNDLGQLVQVVTPAGTWSYEYDVLGNRIATVHNGERIEYLLDPLGMADVLAEYDANGNLIARYVHGFGLEARLDAAGDAAHYQFDAIGSTAGITGSDGAYLNSYRYRPYGESFGPVVESVSNPFQFVGQLGVAQEENGLDYMRARFYSPEDGRFVSEDPIRFGGGINLYRYVENQPTGLVDPSGLVAPAVGLVVVGGINVGKALFQLGVIASAGATGALGYVLLNQVDDTVEGEPVTDPTKVDQIPNGWRMPPLELPTDVNGLPVTEPTETQSEFAALSLDLLTTGGFSLGMQLVSSFPRLGSFFGDWACDLLGCDPIDPNADDVIDISFTDQFASLDPNDILGPAGFGAEGFIKPGGVLPYTIRFENVATATAPAAEVRITQVLDPDLDWTSFELGDFGFGEVLVDVPAGRDFYSTRIDATATLGVLVDVTAGIDVTTGIVTWTFTALDPETLDLPIDPLVGFLPPNRTSPEGEGFVDYTIRPKVNLSAGTRLDAQARIFFDTNAPIDTPAIFNTTDAGPPTSSVDPLPAVTTSTSFTVIWSGSDNAGGSGIASYDVYVSDNGGPFQPWLLDTVMTSEVFSGVNGHRYGFYSVATDNVGLMEAPAGVPDSVTLITIGAEENQPPVLDPIADRNTEVGQAVTFTATASDPDDDNFTFSLDAGAPTGAAIDPATGEFSFTPIAAQAGQVFSITVRVTDDGDPAQSDTETFEIAVQPQIEPQFTLSAIAGPGVGVPGQLRTYSVTFTDPASVGGYTATINWGDGATDRGFISTRTAGGVTTGAVSFWHTYATLGDRTLRLTLRDGQGNELTDDHFITVQLVTFQPDPLDPTKRALVAGGFNAADVITFNPDGGGVNVMYHNYSHGRFTFDGSVIAFGQGGNDTIRVHQSLSNTAMLFGQDGDDLLVGSAGSNVLVGGAGNDTLYGYAARDLLFGGLGADMLHGIAPDEFNRVDDGDLIASDLTAWEYDPNLLASIFHRWTSANSYADRLRSLRYDRRPALNNTTVFDDFAADKLIGGTGLDWFVFFSTDWVTDREAGEHGLGVPLMS